MANDITSRPWKLDTAGAVYSDMVYIAEFIWSGQAAAGDHLIVKNRNGKILIDTRADAPNDDQRWGRLGWVEGITVDTIDSGTVFIYP